MKKVMFIVFGILFGFESNMFGYTWGVFNNTGARIGINFCVGINTCQNANVDDGKWQHFNFDGALLFQTATISNVMGDVPTDTTHINADTFNRQTSSMRWDGGAVKVVKRDGTYFFSIEGM